MLTAQNVAAALRAAANALDGGNAPGALAPVQPAPIVQPAQQPATVSADDLTALIMPHVGNETIKTALGVAMRNLGVGALAEAQPHQYAPLYAAFQTVLAQHGVGGAAPPASVSTSII